MLCLYEVAFSPACLFVYTVSMTFTLIPAAFCSEIFAQCSFFCFALSFVYFLFITVTSVLTQRTVVSGNLEVKVSLTAEKFRAYLFYPNLIEIKYFKNNQKDVCYLDQ